MVMQKKTMVLKELGEIQQAANQETKSSAGDKYETGRAMMHLEKEKLSAQLAEAMKMKQALDKIDPDKVLDKVELGAVVTTTSANYFIAASLGKIEIGGVIWFAVSPATPVGQKLLGKKSGDSFVIGGNQQIESVS